MKQLHFVHRAVCIAAAMLAGCGGSQLPIGAPNAAARSSADTQTTLPRTADGLSATAEYTYVANSLSNNISAYAINATSGALTQVQGSPFAAGYGPYGVAIDPTGKFAYVANNGTVSGHYTGNVSAFAINPRSGTLTPVPGSPFAAGSNPIAAAISPNGKFVYAVNYNSRDVSVFTVSASTGALKQVKASPFKIRRFPTAVAVDPMGRFLYITYLGSLSFYPGYIVGYTINAHDGTLHGPKGSRVRTGADPVSAAIDPAGKFIYVVSYYGYVYGYAIDAITGALKEAGVADVGTDPTGVAIDPTRPFAYVALDLDVAGYAIARDGSLTPVQGSPFGAGYLANAVAIDPPGRFAFVANFGANNVSGYVINRNSGVLTQVQASPFASGEHPAAIAICEIEHDRCVPSTL